ncbi:CvpA family protein [Intestinimonas massiliensis (ex Afouda et al. 2020)]|uniref:CvpA family protein n=1 Tax=Intestinimonas massiliensis (ex Afouda et al. 2020) TaxID=1673721 RepID=UPI00102F48F1|nr:CvpA family protein [Intestinimonas massiliensis (ex Afouda et al. 2020)]
MTAFLILDLIIVAVFLIFAAIGAHRGLVLSLCGLLAVLVAFVGASFAARTLSPMVANALEPRFAAAIEEQLNEQIQNSQVQTDLTDPGAGEVSPDTLPLQDVLNALREMGFYETLIDSVNQAVEDGMTAVAASAAAQVAAAIAQSAAYLIIFLVGFVLILVAWKLISHTLDLVARLPGLHFLNKTLGALFGLIQACIILFIAAWLLQFFGGILPQDAVEKTYLLKFFMSANPFALLNGIL